MPNKSKGWVAIDFDRTLVEYHKDEYNTKGKTYIGPPIKSMLRMVQNLILKGYDVRIMTARDIDDPEVAYAITKWCTEIIGKSLVLTNVKDHHMVCIFDDRAVSVRANKGQILGFDIQLENIINDAVWSGGHANVQVKT
jgi:hypothetical protein